MTEQSDRRYALTKLGRGDYLLPSNDGQTIWRLATYEDGIAQGLDHDLGTVWGLWKWTGRARAVVDPDDWDFVDPDDWDSWRMVSSAIPTRAEAIREALRCSS